MKTPEELAEESANRIAKKEGQAELIKKGFLAGYSAANRWIPVAEELPPVGEKVVGYRAIMGTYSIVFLSSVGSFMFAYEPEYASDITHWKPLSPLPSKG